MMEGRLIQVGVPREIYLHPGERFIAEFVGRINFLEGEVTEAETGGRKKVARTAIGPVECLGLEGRAVGDKVRMGIRAESIKVVEKGHGGRVNCFTGVVQSAVFLGEYIDCEIAIQEKVLAVKVPPELEIGVGAPVTVLLPYHSWILLS
jgi:ABC-type Fe3+/spermidine/putrescine transport system ATPase subunit